jgi:hypothetical protein
MEHVRFCVLAWLLAACAQHPSGIAIDAGPREANDADVTLDPSGCVADQVFTLGHDGEAHPGRIVGLAASVDSFGIVWNELRASVGQVDVYGIRLSSTGVLGPEQAITMNASRERAPAIVSLDGTWIAAWVDNSSGENDLRARALSAELAPIGAQQDISDTRELDEDSPSFAPQGSALLLGWIETDPSSGASVLRMRALGADAVPFAAPSTASSTRPAPFASGELSDGPALLWADPDTKDVMLQKITTEGATRGTTSVISLESNADGTLDAALTPAGGAVVFGALVSGARREVRFRALDASGAPIDTERVIGAGSDASIAAFAGGFAVSYRASSFRSAPPQIRIAFVTALGDVIVQAAVADALDEGGRTSVRASGDGQLAIAWADRSVSGTDVRAALVSCR